MGIKFLTESETCELFGQIGKDTGPNAVRNLAIFTVAKYCALRVSEIGMLLIRDYDPMRGQIYCRREKGSLNNTIRIIDRDVRSALDAYYQERIRIAADSPHLFLSSRKLPISRQQLHVLMKKYCMDTSIDPAKRHFHALKHTRAVELAEMGVNAQDVQWWLGHKRIDNTLIYMQFTTKQQERLYEFLEKYERKNTWQIPDRP